MVQDWHLRLDTRNELRVDRGVYRLSVTQLQYSEVDLVDGEQRPGCVSFGQWRYFRIRTSSAADASITVHALAGSGRGLGGVYLQQWGQPTETSYAAMAERGDPMASAQRVSVSPCSLNVSTVWWVAVMLEDHATATSRGVPPTQFVLSVRLENSILPMRSGSVTPRGSDDPSLPARGTGGDGFACCGAFKYFLVPQVAAHMSLRTQLQVTSGVARAVYLKAGSCPAFPEDVSGQACTGFCTVDWMTRFDPYDGSSISKSATSVVVPNGMGDGCPAACPADLRAEGDWYIGVQALPGTEAEFSMSVSVVEPPVQDLGHQCDQSAPECRDPATLTNGRDASGALNSAAPSSGRRSGMAWRSLSWTALVTLACAAHTFTFSSMPPRGVSRV